MYIDDVILSICPKESPFVTIWKYARIEFQRHAGGSMRKQRRRKAKPIRFTEQSKLRVGRHEWVTRTL